MIHGKSKTILNDEIISQKSKKNQVNMNNSAAKILDLE